MIPANNASDNSIMYDSSISQQIETEVYLHYVSNATIYITLNNLEV